MKKLTIVSLLTVTAIFIGTAAACNLGFVGGMHSGLGMKFNETPRFNQTLHGFNITEELNLSANATISEVRTAMEERREAEFNETVLSARQKLGLPENATNGELNEALNQWRSENENVLRLSAHDGRMPYGRNLHGGGQPWMLQPMHANGKR